MVSYSKVTFILSVLLACVGCSHTTVSQGSGSGGGFDAKEPVSGSRIAWDYSTLRKVSSSELPGRYNGYARVIQLQDRTLICVYEASGSVVTVKSHDLGNTWSSPVIVAEKPENYSNANPEILELQDKSILVSYNPRPGNIHPSRKFEIRTKKSYDGGMTWKDERLLYQAGHQFEDGCWEPAAIQLPSGEIQVYFANEGPYTSSEEQNISLLRSKDNGLTWTTKPEFVSFRARRRDGMPSPLLLQNGKEIVVAIEDNAREQFKPYVVRTTVTESWRTTVTAKSPNRDYALAERVADSIYAGAPYIRQLKNGETILSYQGTEGRGNHMRTSEMKVVIGNDQARQFTRKTAPFPIPQNTSGLWNSLCVLDDNTVVALTTTRGFSAKGITEVWMIKGHVVPELEAKRQSISVDGDMQEAIWLEPFPVFVGQKGNTQLRSSLSYDEQYLYVLNKVTDQKVVLKRTGTEEADGVAIQVDPGNLSYSQPDKGVYSFVLSAAGDLMVKEGENGSWIPLNGIDQVKKYSKPTATGYVQEMAIPWAIIGGKPPVGDRIGFNAQLIENAGKGEVSYRENISANQENEPFSWLTLRLK
ncbi:MAG: sugar-binding protein [Rufibacter sp.]